MRKKTKIWLYIALVLSIATTVLNATSGRWISVLIAIAAMAGLAVLLFAQRKLGYIFMCACYAVSFVNGIAQSFDGETNPMAAIAMSLIGCALIPGITALFLRADWKNLK